MPTIKANFPEKVKDFEFAANNPEEYFKKVKENALLLEKKYNLKIREIVRHS